MLDETFEGIFWLIDVCWQVGVVLFIGSIGGFAYTLPGAVWRLAMADSAVLAQIFPKLYPISCFTLPGLWLLLAVVFAWASHRSWMKKNQDPLRWY